MGGAAPKPLAGEPKKGSRTVVSEHAAGFLARRNDEE
jgi:hypothetical protein